MTSDSRDAQASFTEDDERQMLDAIERWLEREVRPKVLQLERHADALKRSVAHRSLDLGLRHYSRADLEAVRARGQTLHIHVLGLASIADDVTPELACATIESIEVLGALRASPAVKAALADRMP
jgi:hypothetical protein